MKRWTQVFKALANINRLKILKLLREGGAMNVTNIASEISISVNATSKHLIMLHNLDFLESRGTAGHVFYSINSTLPPDIKRAVSLFVR